MARPASTRVTHSASSLSARSQHVIAPLGEAHGIGSGFIIGSNGVILTNAHVVGDIKTVAVKLQDRREFQGEVIGADMRSDVAVVHINAKDLPVVTIGDSSRVRPGDPVLAIGSPYGSGNAATARIVSATDRSLPDDAGTPFIQTDVAVNPVNSDGPLFNTSAQVIGVNTVIFSRTGGYQGLSFAIPIDTAMHIESQLVIHGKVTRGHLGVTVQEVDEGPATGQEDLKWLILRPGTRDEEFAHGLCRLGPIEGPTGSFVGYGARVGPLAST